MKYKEILDDLYDYCRWDKSEKVKEILQEYSIEKIDILYDEGVLLKIVLSSETTDLLRVLLDYYYDQYKLKDQSIENYTLEQSAEKHKLYQILQDTYVPEEMLDVLKEEYSINLTDDNSSVGDLEEFETDFIEKGNNSQSTTGSNGPEKDDVLKDIITDSSGYLLEKNQIGLVGDKALIHNEEGVYHIFDNINNHEI